MYTVKVYRVHLHKEGNFDNKKTVNFKPVSQSSADQSEGLGGGYNQNPNAGLHLTVKVA